MATTAKPPMEKRLWTAEEAATYLSMSKYAVWRLIRSGAIPSIRYGPSGRALRVDPKDVETWIAKAKMWGPER
jgi:excisionase family DNA binding protein